MKTGNKVIDEAVQGSTTELKTKANGDRKVYIESYGCQMNFSDSEIVRRSGCCICKYLFDKRKSRANSQE